MNLICPQCKESFYISTHSTGYYQLHCLNSHATISMYSDNEIFFYVLYYTMNNIHYRIWSSLSDSKTTVAKDGTLILFFDTFIKLPILNNEIINVQSFLDRLLKLQVFS